MQSGKTLKGHWHYCGFSILPDDKNPRPISRKYFRSLVYVALNLEEK